MNIVGLITEYNPFHNGHQYHLKKALEVTGADAALVAMSGDFVQRGAPAIMPKHLRAEAALRCGAAAVMELPVCYATGSAEYFALGAVSLFESLGCVSSICFGTESGELHALKDVARILSSEPKNYQKLLKSYMKSGVSFPIARQKALADYTGDSNLSDLLNKPNNILGIEYLKALYRLNSSMIPYTIGRMESDYHDTALCKNFSSASAIRKRLASDGNMEGVKEQMPNVCATLMKDAYHTRYPLYENDFSLLLKYRLLSMTKERLCEYVDIHEDLANRILKHRNDFRSFEQFCDLLKTRQLTYTRISRALLHILLDVKKNDLLHYLENGFHGYARILGFRKDFAPLLKELKENSRIPLVSKLTSTDGIHEPFLTMLRQDVFASDLYETVLTDKFQTPFINEYEHRVVLV